MAKNLLKNPSGEEQMKFWELTDNGGDHWKVEDMPGGGTCFATSFELCLKRQEINLLKEGYSCDQLDAQPAVIVEDWYSGRSDCGSTYQIKASLLDEHKKVIQKFDSYMTLNPDSDASTWKQFNHTFSNYGPGMRFITFEHGGQDANFWRGWYGVRLTRSAVYVE